jgi:two-component system cell cycle sensor histidine kinase/response regulator CckA
LTKPPSTRQLVLNVDDSEERLRYRTMVLRDAGFDVLEAHTGTSALDLASRRHPSLILLDVNLPDIDGFEVCAQLKARGASTRDIPVLHVSAALCEDEHWVQGLRAGSEGYLREPVGDDVLIEVIRTILDRVEERAILERQLRQANKLEALGLLTGGIAHDFNNALTVILGFADVLALHTPEDTPVGRDLAQIRHAAEHASGLAHQLLAFSREQPLLLTIVDLNSVVEEATGMVKCLLRETIRVEVAPGSGACLINADRAQLEQVLINLAANARDAMPDGGVLTIETSHVPVDARFALGNPPLEPGRYVRLTVRDTGQGMSPEIKQRIFDPFFTTKNVGDGTGLGLSTVYGITKQLRGFILVESGAGEGTRFDLYFPEAMGLLPVRPEPAALETASTAAGVLVVEDDAAVRALTVDLLRRHGYRVVEASGAPDVARLSASVLEDVNLLLADMVMPVLPGPALAKRLLAHYPHLRVLYMSGYSGRRNGEPLPEGSILRKPFTASELLQAVKTALSSSGNAVAQHPV